MTTYNAQGIQITVSTAQVAVVAPYSSITATVQQNDVPLVPFTVRDASHVIVATPGPGAQYVFTAPQGTVYVAGQIIGYVSIGVGTHTFLVRPGTQASLSAFQGDSGAGGSSGIVPAPGAGDFAAGKFLSAGGGWVVPAEASGEITGSVSASHLVGASGTGVIADIPGTSIDFTNGLITIAPIGTGVALVVTGDGSSSDILQLNANGGSGGTAVTIGALGDTAIVAAAIDLGYLGTSGEYGILIDGGAGTIAARVAAVNGGTATGVGVGGYTGSSAFVSVGDASGGSIALTSTGLFSNIFGSVNINGYFSVDGAGNVLEGGTLTVAPVGTGVVFIGTGDGSSSNILELNAHGGSGGNVFLINSAGLVTIAQPTTGIALTINGAPDGSLPLNVTAPAGGTGAGFACNDTDAALGAKGLFAAGTETDSTGGGTSAYGIGVDAVITGSNVAGDKAIGISISPANGGTGLAAEVTGVRFNSASQGTTQIITAIHIQDQNTGASPGTVVNAGILIDDQTAGSPTISPDIFTGVGLNDLTTSGPPTVDHLSPGFVVTIDSVSPGNTFLYDTFTWTVDGGGGATGVPITGAPQLLADGVSITFAALVGHTLADSWAFFSYLPAVYSIHTGAGIVYFGGQVVQPLANAPANSSAAGIPGQIAWDAAYVYICTALNTWVRNTVPFNTF